MAASYSNTRWQSHGPSGQFSGGGAMTGDKMEIEISVTSNFNNSGTQGAKKEVQELGGTTEDNTAITKANREAIDDQVDALRKQISPIRSVAWDLQLLGRSVSIVNKEFFGNNETIRQMTGLIYGVGSAMRILVTLWDLYAVAIDLGIVKSGLKSAANITEAGTTMGLAGAYAILQSVLMNPYAMIALSAGVGIAAGATAAYMGSMKNGGYVNQTGPYLLHKGETVVPAGGTNFSNVNINMNAGGISSNVDVDNMLNSMARRMIVETRRRGA